MLERRDRATALHQSANGRASRRAHPGQARLAEAEPRWPRTRCASRPEIRSQIGIPTDAARVARSDPQLCEDTSWTRELENTQAALLARFAPDTRVRRIRWSQGETQCFELGTGSPLLYVHGGLGGAYEVVPILAALAKPTASSRSIGRGTGWPIRSTIAASICSPTLGRSWATSSMRSSSRPATSLPTRWAGSGRSRSRSTLPAESRASCLSALRSGLTPRPPLLMLPLGLPLIGPRLGRHIFSNATRDGSRRFWGQVLVEHPERLDDLLLDVDVAHTRRNVESMLGLSAVHCRWRRLGYRRELILGKRWGALTTPTLLLWPEHDAFGSPEEGEALVARNPNLRLVRVAGAGHNPWIDDPESVVAEIGRFVATGRQSGADGAPDSVPRSSSPLTT